MPTHARRRGYASGAHGVLALAVVAWSFSWTFVTGHRGIFAFDQSIVFDGAWRILCGQVPYEDFVMAFTPLAFLLQAGFFALLGVTWTAYVVSAASIAALAALSVMRTTALLYGAERRWLVLSCGFLVGSLFQSVFGTLMLENVSLLFGLLGLQAFAESTRSGPRGRCLWTVAAGVAGGLALLAKQNSGVLALVFLGAAALVSALPDPRRCARAVLQFGGGAALVAALFAGWLWAFSDPALFWRHTVEVPLQLGAGRIPVRDAFLPRVFMSVPGFSQWVYALALGAQTFALFTLASDRRARARILARPGATLALFLPGATVMLHVALQKLTVNEYYNLLFLSALALCSAAGVAGLLAEPASVARRWSAVAASAVGACVLFEGMHDAAWMRRQHDAFPIEHRVSARLHIAPLANVRWIEPTLVHTALLPPGEHVAWPPRAKKHDMRGEDLEQLYAYLAPKGRRFFVLGDCAFLYGALGMPPPQPLLYFQDDHYYTREDLPALDAWMLASLETHGVDTVIREQALFGTDPARAFPRTTSWIEREFVAGPRFGHFEVLLRR